MSMNDLRGRIAIVTGASRRQGIGSAICRALAADWADIFFTHWSSYDHTMPWGAEENWPAILQNELREMSVRCESLAVDPSLYRSLLPLRLVASRSMLLIQVQRIPVG